MGILDIFKDGANSLNKKGIKLLAKENYHGALKCFNEALKIEPGSYKIRFNRAITLWELGKACEAIKEYDEVLDINPEHAGTWFNLGVIISLFGRYNDALDFIDIALELEHEDALMWYIKGLILKKVNRSSEALECLEKAFKLDPGLQSLEKVKDLSNCFNTSTGY
jgi:tetratricopeptide (TPR) repeat protein